MQAAAFMTAQHQKQPVGLYLHIPYCARKCRYCDFTSFCGLTDTQDTYVDRVIREMQSKAPSLQGRTVDTLFIGGGTPSLLRPDLMKRLLDAVRSCFTVEEDAEMSCEMNPGTVTADFLAVLREGGINRVSMGAQAMQDHLLTMLGRIHSAGQTMETLKLIRNAGFTNINCDVMFGLPGQTLQDLSKTLDILLNEGITHLSCYGLICEEGTPLTAAIDRGELTLPEEETERAMYEMCMRKAENAGMIHYEISNFAKPGRECLHNVHCWERREYLGIGCAAAEFLNGVRARNPLSYEAYLKGEAAETEVIGPEDARFESMMLGLRMMKGVNEKTFEEMHGMSLKEAFGKQLEPSVRDGLIVYENGTCRLTRAGMDLQNQVLIRLMD